MSLVGRIYATEERADAAVQRLKDADFPAEDLFLVRSGASAEAMPDGLTKDQAITYSRMLSDGKSTLVLVNAQFGWGERVTRILNDCGPVSTKDLEPIRPRNPAPFSSFLGLPVLSTRGSSVWSLIFPSLTSPGFHLSEVFGLKLLLPRKQRWEKSFGVDLLAKTKRPWQKSFGMNLLLETKRPWRKSFGLPLLKESR